MRRAVVALLLLCGVAHAQFVPPGGGFVPKTNAQTRVSGTCGVGNAIRVINADGSVTCQAVAGGGGTVTAVTGGSGVTVTNGTTTPNIAIDGSVWTATSRQVIAGTGMTGGGSLAADRTLTLNINAGSTQTATAGQAFTGMTALGILSSSVFVNAAGTGLTLTGSSLAVDPTVVQSRVSGTCTGPNAVRAVAQDGTVTCTTGVSTLTNGAGANVIAKSDGTNLVASGITDNGTTISTSEAVSITGNTTVAGLIGTVQLDTSTGTTTDFSLTSTTTTIAWQGASAATFNGISGGTAGRRICIVNISNGQSLTIGNESGTAANRTRNAGAASFVIATAANGGGGGCYEYSGALSRWVEISRSSSQINYQLSAVSGIRFGVGTGRLQDASTGPTLTSCGTSPSVTTGEGKFTITVGSTATGCIATFATAFTNTPTCIVSAQAPTASTGTAYTVSSTAITLGTGTTSSAKYDIDCTDH